MGHHSAAERSLSGPSSPSSDRDDWRIGCRTETAKRVGKSPFAGPAQSLITLPTILPPLFFARVVPTSTAGVVEGSAKIPPPLAAAFESTVQ
jgi:hypothetical protein